MALGTTFNLPNYTGQIFNVTPQDTPFLTAISGLSAQNFNNTIAGAVPTDSTVFQWQTLSLRSASTNNAALEGAAAPTDEVRARSNVINVVEIHHEAVGLSYTKLAATGQFATTGATQAHAAGLNGQPIDEMQLQLNAMWAQIARDVEWSFLFGTIQQAATDATERHTQGLIGAITTNVKNAAGYDIADDTEDPLLDLMQTVYDAGGISQSETAALICGSYQKRRITKKFITDANYQERSRNIGGVNATEIETDFGRLVVLLDRHMSANAPGTVVVASLEQIRPRVLNIPSKGVGFFAEPLAKTGATDRTQFYGEIGLEYGNQLAHGKVINLPTSSAVAS